MQYGSDLIVQYLSKLGVDLITLNPGATIRGLHDSLVRSDGPDMVLALHEEIAVGMAHGYAKASGKPAAVFVHDLVGLQHASMAIFNAWADSVPLLVVGGSGPRDATCRRPWIDWVHTGLPQASLVREFVKWDDEPGSLEAVPDSLTHALQVATRAPCGPVYVSIDVALQECSAADVTLPDPPRIVPTTVSAPAGTVRDLADVLRRAESPVAIVDLPQRGLATALSQLADLIGIDVIDLGGGANFASEHRANRTHRRPETLAAADVVLALDVRDLQWSISSTDQRTRTVTALTKPDTPIYSVSHSELQLRGFINARSYVSHAHNIVGDAVQLVQDVTSILDETGAASTVAPIEAGACARSAREEAWREARSHASAAAIHPAHLAATLWEAVSDGPWQLANGKLDGWLQRLWNISADEHFLGLSGGHGLGYGMPASLGAAYVQKDTDTLVVNVQGDGDLMYTASALWTAARYKLPVLTVVHNNRSYGKDEMHQREIARTRGRSIDLVGVGIDLGDPDISYVKLAESQGMEGVGAVSRPDDLAEVLRRAAHTVRSERRPVLVDVLCPIPAGAATSGAQVEER